jgi:methionine synthase I (cobalamin-dependent)/5,10-methylenetetrahydrofolate reductase
MVIGAKSGRRTVAVTALLGDEGSDRIRLRPLPGEGVFSSLKPYRKADSVHHMSRQTLLIEKLESGKPILADGAMGTMLHAQGISLEACFDELNLSRPDIIIDIHRAYVEAGARIIETNTFGANRHKLSAHGLEAKVTEINRAAVLLAQQAIHSSSEPTFIAGSVGPLGVRLAPFGRVHPEQAFEAYLEQIKALVEAGIDLLVIETQNDLVEVQQAVEAARQVADIPVIAMVNFTRDDRMLLGDSPARAAQSLHASGADIIGANCSGGPAQLLRVLAHMRSAVPAARYAVMPNAGWPERVSGRIMYPATSEYFGEYAVAFCEAGATIVGGCCGTTPEHIAQMRAALEKVDLPYHHPSPALPAAESLNDTTSNLPPTSLAQKVAAGQFIVSVEMDPPRGFSTHKLLAGAHLLADAGADVINVADSPMARMRMSPWAVCHLIQRDVGLDTVLHFPTRGRNLLRVQGDLLAAHAVDVRNIFVVMGDPTAIGDYPEAMDNYDLVPSGLIRLVQHGFNAGIDHSGADIGEATSFFVGCALNLCPIEHRREMRVLKKKIEAGANFALTQPTYEPDCVIEFLEDFTDQYGELPIAVLIGVLPLYSLKHAAFLQNEVPGIRIPSEILARIEAAGDSAPEVGVQIAVELLQQLRPYVQGAYIMPPFGRYDLAAQIIDHIRADERVNEVQPI